MKAMYRLEKYEDNYFVFTRKIVLHSVEKISVRTVDRKEAEQAIGKAILKHMKIEHFQECFETWTWEAVL